MSNPKVEQIVRGSDGDGTQAVPGEANERKGRNSSSSTEVLQLIEKIREEKEQEAKKLTKGRAQTSGAMPFRGPAAGGKGIASSSPPSVATAAPTSKPVKGKRSTSLVISSPDYATFKNMADHIGGSPLERAKQLGALPASAAQEPGGNKPPDRPEKGVEGGKGKRAFLSMRRKKKTSETNRNNQRLTSIQFTAPTAEKEALQAGGEKRQEQREDRRKETEKSEVKEGKPEREKREETQAQYEDIEELENVFAIALYDFEALPEHEYELSFKEGDIIRVTEQPDGDWWTGETDNGCGYFPHTFVKLAPPPALAPKANSTADQGEQALSQKGSEKEGKKKTVKKHKEKREKKKGEKKKKKRKEKKKSKDRDESKTIESQNNKHEKKRRKGDKEKGNEIQIAEVVEELPEAKGEGSKTETQETIKEGQETTTETGIKNQEGVQEIEPKEVQDVIEEKTVDNMIQQKQEQTVEAIPTTEAGAEVEKPTNPTDNTTGSNDENNAETGTQTTTHTSEENKPQELPQTVPAGTASEVQSEQGVSATPAFPELAAGPVLGMGRGRGRIIQGKSRLGRTLRKEPGEQGVNQISAPQAPALPTENPTPTPENSSTELLPPAPVPTSVPAGVPASQEEISKPSQTTTRTTTPSDNTTEESNININNDNSPAVPSETPAAQEPVPVQATQPQYVARQKSRIRTPGNLSSGSLTRKPRAEQPDKSGTAASVEEDSKMYDSVGRRTVDSKPIVSTTATAPAMSGGSSRPRPTAKILYKDPARKEALRSVPAPPPPAAAGGGSVASIVNSLNSNVKPGAVGRGAIPVVGGLLQPHARSNSAGGRGRGEVVRSGLIKSSGTVHLEPPDRVTQLGTRKRELSKSGGNVNTRQKLHPLTSSTPQHFANTHPTPNTATTTSPLIPPNTNVPVFNRTLQIQNTTHQRPTHPPQIQNEIREDIKNVPYAELKKRPPGVDCTKLESYLTDEEFQTVLKMTREEFYSMALWRQQRCKREAFLS